MKEYTLKYAADRIEELRKENEALKLSLSTLERFRIEDAASAIDDHNDMRTRLKDEIERLKESNKELVEALKDTVIRANKARDILTNNGKENCWNMLNMEKYAPLLQKSEGYVNK